MALITAAVALPAASRAQDPNVPKSVMTIAIKEPVEPLYATTAAFSRRRIKRAAGLRKSLMQRKISASTLLSLLAICAAIASPAAAYDSPLEMVAKPYRDCMAVEVRGNLTRGVVALNAIWGAFDLCKARYGQQIYLMYLIQEGEQWATKFTDFYLNNINIQYSCALLYLPGQRTAQEESMCKRVGAL